MAHSSDQVAREEMQMLTFTLENVSYGVNVNQVREVRKIEGVTPVPYAPEYVKGVTNLRGEIIPVIDLRKRFGIDSKRSSEESGIMVIAQDKHAIGVMVDSVMEVLTLDKKNIEANPESLVTERSVSILGVAKHDKDLIVLLDLMKIVSKEEIKKMKEDAKGFQVQTQTQTTQVTA